MNDKKEEIKQDAKICTIGLGLLALWIIISLNPPLFFIIIVGFYVLKVVLFLSVMAVVNDERTNNGKEGYYAQYGTSFGANAHKHEQYKKRQEHYIEDRVANEVINKK